MGFLQTLEWYCSQMFWPQTWQIKVFAATVIIFKKKIASIGILVNTIRWFTSQCIWTPANIVFTVTKFMVKSNHENQPVAEVSLICGNKSAGGKIGFVNLTGLPAVFNCLINQDLSILSNISLWIKLPLWYLQRGERFSVRISKTHNWIAKIVYTVITYYFQTQQLSTLGRDLSVPTENHLQFPPVPRDLHLWRQLPVQFASWRRDLQL